MKILEQIKNAISKTFGIFSEISPLSLMRFMSFFMFWFALYETYFIIKTFGNKLNENHILIILIMFAFAFFPKVVQKIIEKKYKKIDNDYDNEKMLKS